MFMIRSGGWIRTVSVPGSGHRYARRFPGFVMSCRRWAMPGNLLPRRLAGLACSGASSNRRKSRNGIRRGAFLSRLQENQGVFEAQGLDAISVRGGQSLRFALGNRERKFPVAASGGRTLDAVFWMSSSCPGARGRPGSRLPKKDPRWNVFYRGLFVERPSSGSAPR